MNEGAADLAPLLDVGARLQERAELRERAEAVERGAVERHYRLIAGTGRWLLVAVNQALARGERRPSMVSGRY